MNSKFYQSIDNIHGTIYYTQLEKLIVNTPFFNRLHDVNQSSTVYLAFPPNRTKRYEHSFGTMQVTSDIFYNAAINSSGEESLTVLLENADREFAEITKFIKKGKGKSQFIFSFDEDILSALDGIKKTQKKEDIETIIRKNCLDFFCDNCLLNLVPRSITDCYQVFLFICLLQALRLVGLLHDIGHPPQSHIIETVLGEIYDVLQGKAEEERTQRQVNFVEILASYQDITDQSISQIDERMAIITKNRKLEHLHEMIGIQIIKNIVEQVFPEEMKKSIKKNEKAKNTMKMLYYFTIIEFIFAIIRNKNAFWSGIHSIVDGVIDTDRLDFVQRDCENSGMPWGKVSYKRLINTVKLGLICDKNTGDSIQVCFSAKNVPIMDELLDNRYKIFTLINYHHRSTKFSALYQGAVKSLILHYLESTDLDSEENAYFSNISGLWRALELVYSKNSSMLNLIQWNDSWLNGLLYKHLIEECADPTNNEHLQTCRKFLEEIFLNERKHSSLIKRKTELLEINNAAWIEMGPLLKKIENEIVEVHSEIKAAQQHMDEGESSPQLSEKLEEKKEALCFLQKLHDPFVDFDWKEIETNLGNELFSNAMHKILANHKEIDNYFMEKVRFSLGTTGKAYVYDLDGNLDDYYEHSDIKRNLEFARLGFPYHYIYIKYKKFEEIGNKELSELRKEIGKEIGIEIVNIVESKINFEKTAKDPTDEKE